MSWSPGRPQRAVDHPADDGAIADRGADAGPGDHPAPLAAARAGGDAGRDRRARRRLRQSTSCGPSSNPLDRYVVLVDDAEMLFDAPNSPILERIIVTGRDADHGLILAGTTGDLSRCYTGFIPAALKSRCGVLVTVDTPDDGDLFGVRLPRNAGAGADRPRPDLPAGPDGPGPARDRGELSVEGSSRGIGPGPGLQGGHHGRGEDLVVVCRARRVQEVVDPAEHAQARSGRARRGQRAHERRDRAGRDVLVRGALGDQDTGAVRKPGRDTEAGRPRCRCARRRRSHRTAGSG